MTDWESQIAAERMAVDGEFNDRVTASSLSPQQWNMVMTAVSFEIRNPTTPADAELYADTSKLDSMLPEIEQMGEASPMGGARSGGGGGGGGGSSGGDGFLDGILSTLGMSGGSSSDELRAEAEELAEEYAERLQAKLVENGRWETICERAASG